MKVAVVGGGISGLAAAWALRDDAEVTVFEPDRLGGKIRTTPFDGLPVEEGPDAFLTRDPPAVELCRELGLEADLIAPQAGQTLLWHGGRLRPLPDGLLLGVPTDIWPVARSGILSLTGLARAGLEPLLPRTRNPESLTVRRLIGSRFGYQVADRLVDPLVGGIHAGWTGELSAGEVVPQLAAAARHHRSLLLGLRASPSSGPPAPAFLTPRFGLSSLVEKLVAALSGAGTRFETARIDSVAPDGDGVRLEPVGQRYDAMVIAVPAHLAADLVGDPPDSALRHIPTASVALATISLPGAQLPEGFNGFLASRDQGLMMTACSFASNKWPHWTEPGRPLVRLSCGRFGDDRPDHLDDDALIQRLAEELSTCLGTQLRVGSARVSRWPDAFPQYRVGHTHALADSVSQLHGRMPTVHLAGASYAGSGIPACIRSGRRAAAELLASVRVPARPGN